MQTTPKKVILSSGKDLSVKRFHPWVFSGAIKKIKNEQGKETEVEDGEIVSVYSNKDEFLGYGHFQNGSIAVRMLTFEDFYPDEQFWLQKISAAYHYRLALNIENEKTNVYRLVHAEGDGLPGLIIDYYNGICVVQTHSVGMHKQIALITHALVHTLGSKCIAVYDKSAETLPEKYATSYQQNGFLFGNAEAITVSENGNLFRIDFVKGQKTGFFIDQRENRNLLAMYCKNKTVLNTFCYSGGFSVYAINNGAKMVHSVDSSKKAIELTDINVSLCNNKQNHLSFVKDTFDFIEEMKEDYDVVILDPPAFAKHINAKHHAVQGYKRLNAETLKKMKKGSILFTFSCSQAVNRQLFENTIMSAAILAGKQVKIMHHLSQPPDHANSVFHPEGEYLKGLVLYVA